MSGRIGGRITGCCTPPGVADPFGVIRLANQRLDQVRRRVPKETLGHRGRKSTRCIGYAASSPPLPRKSATAVKLGCVTSSTLVTPTGTPGTQTVRGIYGIDTPVLALRYTLQLADDLQDECPPEINKLGRTIARWTPQITNWHITQGNQQMPPKPSTT